MTDHPPEICAPRPKKRQAKWPQLILSLILSPGLAGLIGGPLVMIIFFALTVISDPSGAPSAPSFHENPWQNLGSLFAVSLLSTMFAVPMTYLVGSIPIVLLWWIFHNFGWRSPGQIRLAIMIAGFLFSIAMASHEPFAALIFIAPALLAGWVVGTMISAWGYEKPVKP